MSKAQAHSLLNEFRDLEHEDIEIKPGVLYRIMVAPAGIGYSRFEIVAVNGELVLIKSGSPRP